METFHLDEIVNVDILQKLQDKYSDATGLAAVTVDFRGKPITKYSNFTHFCQTMRSTEYEDRCHQCDAFGGIEASRKSGPHIYHCHAGLVDFAIPIKVKGQFIGSMLAGQVRIEDNAEEKLPQITPLETEWQNDAMLKDAYQELPALSPRQVESSAQLLQTVITNQIEKDISKYLQKQLSEMNMQLQEQMKSKETLEKNMHKKELTALQPQINLNFLQHSLNTASRLAILEKADRTTDTIYAITDYLEYILLQSNTLVTLEEVIAHIRRYLNLQKLRFGNRFQYEIDIPKQLYNVSIPSFILQAIVDNALVHGLETKKENGLLTIKAIQTDDYNILKVMDNGVGIPPNLLEKIQLGQQINKEESTTQATGIDLNMIRKTLNYYYDNDYNLSISSNKHKGTAVTIMIPKKIR